ncbi:NADAR family protein [Cellulomonas cellasea]|uniref:NADAR domain-containing protein n=1 Tax=Cellulomonas cellasea TaxID=43670 RepID=A0A7W4UIK1_9CELL|nr:NADAR family protein [Cellulomonas cellasea]MBB2924825.1 hypothetical protein [Cellulomonas cellasea]
MDRANRGRREPAEAAGGDSRAGSGGAAATAGGASAPRPDERLAALRAADAAGEPVKVVLFWSHRPEKDGSTGRGCFSQWWPAPITVDGVTYPTAEHWMMAGKARLFGDDEGLRAVLDAASPGAAKAAGAAVRGFDEDTWARERYGIVLAGTLAKFRQHPGPAGVLRRTGDQVLAEASPVDRVWGIGRAAGDPDAERPSRWLGLNLLGFALMDARERL